MFHTILPVYHTVSDTKLPHIAHLYRVKTVCEFEADLDFFLKHYTPIDFFEYKKNLENYGTINRTNNCIINRTNNCINNRTNRPSFLLSFDDGLREFHDIIAPILLRKGVPAINFLNSDFIDNKALFFRYKVSVLIDFITQNKGVLQEKLLNDFKQKYAAFAKNPTAFLLNIKYHDQNILAELAAIIGCDFEAFLQKQQPYLTTEQVKTLIKQGFQFGAHSIDHPQYQFLPLAEQLRQTQVSMDFVQQKFALDYRIFAFPFTDFGVSQAFFDTIKKDNIADFTFGCAGQKYECFDGHAHRIPFEKGDLSARNIYYREYAYYWAKAAIGKNVIRR